jgi:glycosyltransferase involved in cell wall biosynthesis
MPHKIFDYMREGIPVIAPDFAVEVRRIVSEADGGLLVDVTNPAVIAGAILRLLRDPAEAGRLGRNGRRMVESRYNWQHDERALLGVFAGLA